MLSFPGILTATSKRDGKNKLVIDPGDPGRCRRALKSRKLPQPSVRPLRKLKSRQLDIICNVAENTYTSKQATVFEYVQTGQNERGTKMSFRTNLFK